MKVYKSNTLLQLSSNNFGNINIVSPLLVQGDASFPIYEGHEDITGTVLVEVTKPMQHIGIKVELIGEMLFNYDRGEPYEFTSLVSELAPPGIINAKEEFKFKLAEIPKRDESYFGVNVRLR